MEIIIRLAAQGTKVCVRGGERVWNIFDSFVLLVSLVDVVILIALPDSDGSFLLALKVLRIVRLVRIIRGEHFRGLRMMVFSMIHTLGSLVWFLLLMALITYCFALCLTQATVEYALRELGEGSDWAAQTESLASEHPLHGLLKHFGTVPRTMYTLLKCVSGGVSWGEPGDIVSELGWVLMTLFLVFI